MPKFRIVTHRSSERTWYEVERKGWFLWNVETYFDCCIDGMCAGDYAHEFDTVDEALDYVCSLNLPNTKINYDHLTVRLSGIENSSIHIKISS